MNKRYRLAEIEEAVSEMEELIGLEDDIAEIDDDFQIVVSGWSVYVESLNLTLRQGIACVWDAEEGLFIPDFDVTIVYEGNIETGYSRSEASVVNESGESMQASFPADSLYYEQDGMVVTLGKEQKHPITKAVLAPMKTVKKMLVSMELHLDASIDKLDNLAMNVQLDKEKHMENAKTKEQTEPERAEAERVEAEIVYAPMVAEPQEYQYNADAFEARGVDEVKQEAAHKEVSKVRADKAR